MEFFYILVGTYEEKCTEKAFKDDLRNALRLAKNRHFKIITAKKKSSTLEVNTSEKIVVRDIQKQIDELMSNLL